MYIFFRWLFGYLSICVRGDNIERFLNLCAKSHIVLSKLVRDEQQINLQLSLGNFYRLKPIVKKTSVKVAVTQRYGLPFFMLKVRKRTIFFMGFIFIVSFLIVMRNYVWAFEFQGNLKITDNNIIDFLQSNEVTYGTKIRSVNFDGLEEALREEFNELIWVSIGMEGTKLKILVKENDLPTYQKNEISNEPCDIVCKNDGVIVSIITRKGTPKVKEGDYVTKGTILVSGSLPIPAEDGTVAYYNKVKSDADICIQYDITYYQRKSRYLTERKYTGKVKTTYSLSVMRLSVNGDILQVDYEKEDFLTKYYQVRILDNYYLPIWFIQKENREYYFSSRILSDEEMSNILSNQLQEFILSFEEKGVQIIEKDVKIYDGGLFMEMGGRLTIRDSTCIREETIVNE